MPIDALRLGPRKRYNRGVRLESIIDMPFLLSGIWARFGVHLFHGKVTTSDIDQIERASDAWRAKHPGKTVEMVVIYPSGARMTIPERLRFARLLKKDERERTASATVVLAEGLTGAAQRSMLTGLLMMAPPPHPAKVFGTTRAAVAWLSPHVQALCGPAATPDALYAAVEELGARFRTRVAG
jgi:hypothetical protein